MFDFRVLQGLAAAAVASFAVTATAAAQVPPLMPPEAAAIANCICLRAATERLGADMSVKQRMLDDIRAQLARASSDLEAERARLDVNNPQAVSRFREMLGRRDDLFRRSNGEAANQTRVAVDRYNSRIAEYNASCANRPMDPILMSRVQATLSCPPLY